MLRQGFLRLEGAVSQELVREARRQININLNSGGENMEAAQAAVAAMFNEGDIKPLLESGLGVEVPEQKGGQMAVLQRWGAQAKEQESREALKELLPLTKPNLTVDSLPKRCGLRPVTDANGKILWLSKEGRREEGAGIRDLD